MAYVVVMMMRATKKQIRIELRGFFLNELPRELEHSCNALKGKGRGREVTLIA